jgi:hypothetical protein
MAKHPVLSFVGRMKMVSFLLKNRRFSIVVSCNITATIITKILWQSFAMKCTRCDLWTHRTISKLLRCTSSKSSVFKVCFLSLYFQTSVSLPLFPDQPKVRDFYCHNIRNRFSPQEAFDLEVLKALCLFVIKLKTT